MPLKAYTALSPEVGVAAAGQQRLTGQKSRLIEKAAFFAACQKILGRVNLSCSYLSLAFAALAAASFQCGLAA